jgi:DNA-directed RNA polymerase specialized sigma24 family protein
VIPFQRFLDEHREAVFRFLVASVGRDAADDCFQETFLAAMKAYPRLRATSNHRAWVLTIANNKAMDHHRARARNAVPVAELPEVPFHDPEPGGGEDTWGRVRELPPKQRAAVLLRYAGDLSHREVAAVLQCSEEAARRSAHEGLKKLRLELTAT